MTTTDRLPQVDMAKHTHPALADCPVLSSEQSGWNGIFFNHYDHPAHESPEHQWMQHIIGITGRGGHPVESEHRLDGQIQNCYCKPGEMLFIPAGVRYSSNWHQAGEFSLLGFSPRFFEQVAHESVQVKRVELIPHIGISDPLVQQIGLRWVDNIICPFITGNKERDRLGTKVNDNPILPVVVPARMTIWEPLEL